MSDREDRRQGTPWFDRYVVPRISPAWALRRAQARIALQAWNEYESVTPSRIRPARKNRNSANVETRRAAADLRSLARHFEQNYDVASGALDVLVANTVGTGIQPEPQVELVGGDELAVELNRELLRLFDDWVKIPEVTRQFDYYSLQRIVARSAFRDGDCFAQKLMGPVRNLDHGTILPYSLEALEADFVPLDDNNESEGVYQGIEVNAWGAPRAYHVYRQHPGDRILTRAKTKSIPARFMLHLKTVKRLHQIRGVSVFAATLARFDDIKDIDESERVAARVAAAMAAYIKKGVPDDYSPKTDEEGNAVPRELEFVPGMVMDDLLPGEDIGTFDPKRPNNALIPFRDSQLRSAAAGLGVGYSSLSKNYSGTYSAQRQELVEQFVHYRTVSSYLVRRFCQPVWDGFIDTVKLTGAIDIPSDVDESTLYNVSHSLPPMPWIDPVKEMSANAIAEDREWKSRSSIIRERGGNPDQVRREVLRDRAERERLGLAGEASTEIETEDREGGDGATSSRLRVVTKRKN